MVEINRCEELSIDVSDWLDNNLHRIFHNDDFGIVQSRFDTDVCNWKLTSSELDMLDDIFAKEFKKYEDCRCMFCKKLINNNQLTAVDNFDLEERNIRCCISCRDFAIEYLERTKNENN